KFTEKILPKQRQLAVTCALEHFTSLLGALVLGDPTTLEGAHPTMAALWKWHSAEENEHKSVAFDVYRAMGGSYLARVWTMIVVTMSFWSMVSVFYLRFMKAAGALWKVREHAALLKRSEERRVGKECRSRWWGEEQKIGR